MNQIDLLRRAGAVDQLPKQLEEVRLGRHRQAHVAVDVAEALDGIAQGDGLPIALPIVGREQQLRRRVPPRAGWLSGADSSLELMTRSPPPWVPPCARISPSRDRPPTAG